MELLLEEIARQCGAGQRVVLCTVVATRGSTPQEKGAKMLVLADGKTLGTLGGGCVEAEVRRRALELLSSGESKLLQFTLDHDHGWDDGLICGGAMDIWAQIIDCCGAEPFRAMLASLRRGAPAVLRMPLTDGEYVEEISPPPRLVIAGAGHVGQALAEVAAKLDFDLTVIDDRGDCASVERFGSATQLVVGDIEQELRRYPIDAGTYVVIVTRGHRHDAAALAAVVDSPAGYIGLIGSKSKIKLILDDLVHKGVPIEKLLRVHAPIGLEIGAVTVPEIALSIAAELVAVRRGREGRPAREMRLDTEEIRAWLQRHES